MGRDAENLDSKREKDADEDDLYTEDVFEKLLGFTGVITLMVLFVVVAFMGVAVAVFW